MTTQQHSGPWGRSWSAPLLALAVAGLVGCGSLLDVENPNNVKEEDTVNPVAAKPLVDGAQRRVSFGLSGVLLPIAEISDELEWCGSRDAWLTLDQGQVSNGYNEFLDAAMPPMAAARWSADYAITTLEAQDADGDLLDRTNLATAYLWGAVAYTYIADWFDDFVFSYKDSAGTPIGHANMRGLYTTALDYLNKGLAIVASEGDYDIGDTPASVLLTAQRARTHFGAAVWDVVAGGGMVNAASADVTAAVTDATTALAAAPSPDWKFQFTYDATTGTPDPGAWINSRQEMRLAPPYVERVGSNKWGNTILMDPLDNVVDPAVDAIQKGFKTANLYVPFTVVSARELHLMLAEAALSGGNTATARTQINAVRALDGLSNYTGAGLSDLQMLQYERQANLYLYGRRLADEYRFNLPSPGWLAGSEALTSPGIFLPITARECLSNPNIGAENCVAK